MTQTAIPFLFMRGGTSRGPYFRREDLPQDRDVLSKVLVSVMGSGNPRNIDGLGGGNAVTTKVAMLSPSEHPDADVDFFFAQLNVDDHEVNYRPTCGNILTGVGPAAIEMGIIPVTGDLTSVRIHAVNTGALIEAEVQTNGGAVRYSGSEAIDGVPGTAAPIGLNFMKVVGSHTDGMFPTGQRIDEINGIEVSCVDVAMPMMIVRASDMGITGYESPDELDANKELFTKIEAMRLQAGEMMGLGDVTKSVVPKVGLISAPREGGHLSVRYFMPWTTHPTVAVTGSQCLAACAIASGTVAEGIASPAEPSPFAMHIEHPAGQMEVRVRYENNAEGFHILSTGLTRTARLIARGEVLVPEELMR